jgi:uncharacterized protein YyaL (SSP411 family)
MQHNRLASETSPYLRQHAENPVDWYPWSSEALALAARENKPILLSVGYSACHWCHVMAHESFEDPSIASLMNRLFVNIKVDREERPDLDKIYQLAQQLITRHNGGWPLTMFLTPDDQRPFFGGTYFPKEPRHGMPGFADVLTRVADYFHGHAAEIRQQNAALAAAFERLAPEPADPDVVLDDAPLQAARAGLEAAFDPAYGGFGRAPKFPQPGSIERCLRHWHSTSLRSSPDLKALYMATLTLTRMAEGGLYDQLGGGFCRYSVDDFWMIPHFEKMLYDNGRLLHLYAAAYHATGEALFARVAGETADWLLRDLGAPGGGFHSSLDADSEGHEGRFYVWSRTEIERLLPAPQFALVARRFGIADPPNFEGRWHLYVREPLENLEGTAGGAAAILDEARGALLEARARRVAPARDDKLLTSWNALAIKGLALAGRVLDRPLLIEAAGAAVDVIRRTVWRDGRLLATSKDGRAHLPAYLDDYAFLADALLELLQARWRSSDLHFARDLVDVLLSAFEDPAGGFFFTASDHEPLIHRTKTFDDDSLPSGNGVAASVLCRMGYLLGDLRYLTAAERTLQAAGASALEHPLAHMASLNALEEFLTSTQILIIRGPAHEARAWARNVDALYAPMRIILAIPDDAPDLPPALAAKSTGAGTTAYRCTGMTCSAPFVELSALARRLASQVAL